jgi:DNA-binding MarR family transcriptional regulator
MVDLRQLFPDARSVTPTPSPPPARPDGGGVDDATLEAVLLGTRVVTAVVAASLDRSGEVVTVLQLRVLVLASTRPGLGATDLAEALGVHVSSASRTVDRLVAAGLLERRESAEDRRRLHLAPTPAGARLLDAVMAERRRELAALLGRMSPRDRDHLARGMAALAEAAGEPAAMAPGGPAPLIP